MGRADSVRPAHCQGQSGTDRQGVGSTVVVAGASKSGAAASVGGHGAGSSEVGMTGLGLGGSALNVVVWTTEIPVMASTAPTPALANSSFSLCDVMPDGYPYTSP
jgi:hypothetical protein